MTLNHFIDRAEKVYPNRVGLVDEPNQPAESWGTMTYGEVATKAREQAAALDAMGVGFGERVAIVSQNSSRLQTALLGLPANGRVAVPINFRLVRAEVAYIVDHCGASVLMIDPELEDELGDIDCKHKFIIGAESDKDLYLPDVEPVAWDQDELATATINYTSGTTARPKGVEQQHRALWVNATTFGWHTGVSDRDVYLHTLPQFHCNGWGMPFAAAGMGVPQVVLRKVDGPEILKRVAEHGVTLMCGAPAVVTAAVNAAADMASEEVPGRDNVRMVVAGAPPPTDTIVKMERDLGWEFIQIYGLTETAPLLTINRCRSEWDDLSDEDRAARLVRAGAPAIGVNMKVSQSGELLAQGNQVLNTYWEQPAETALALEGGWFHTGDGGQLDDEGYYSITDRKKDVIISGGENISSIEVEDALFSHASVAEVAVVGVPSEKWGETPKALVVLAAGTEASEQELIAHCRDRLTHYKCPTSVEFRDALERTATGKLQKYKLRAPYWEHLDRNIN